MARRRMTIFYRPWGRRGIIARSYNFFHFYVRRSNSTSRNKRTGEKKQEKGPTRYRPSGRKFAIRPHCGRLASTLRLPCGHLASALKILWPPQGRPKVTVRHQLKDRTAPPHFRSPQFINTPCGYPKNKNICDCYIV